MDNIKNQSDRQANKFISSKYSEDDLEIGFLQDDSTGELIYEAGFRCTLVVSIKAIVSSKKCKFNLVCKISCDSETASEVASLAEENAYSPVVKVKYSLLNEDVISNKALDIWLPIVSEKLEKKLLEPVMAKIMLVSALGMLDNDLKLKHQNKKNLQEL